MLHRHEQLLTALYAAGRGISRIELMELHFLARQEALEAPCRLYDFLPHKYGPYSFLVEHDLASLGENGMITAAPGRITPMASADRALTHLSAVERAAIENVSRHYSSLRRIDLLRYVYSTYPYFASRSVLVRKPASQPSPPPSDLFTMGYEGQTIDSFLNRMLERRVQTILDVRRNPISHKYGFSKSAMRNCSARVGIAYVHLPQLGIPNSFRKELKTPADYERLFEEYETSLLPQAPEAFLEACRTATEARSALMCFEGDPRFCHRGRLAARMACETGLRVVHLRSDTDRVACGLPCSRSRPPRSARPR